ncbi:MAG: hypothetical protein F6K24_15585 [Okeania sp. SIO2D1]|nr:hypothetical protein [Okeania sp. SIO2D1]
MCKISGIKENFPWNTVDIDLNGRGDGEMGRWGDGEMGRWGDGEMEKNRNTS